MRLQVQKIDKDLELEMIAAEQRLYYLTYDELGKGFWNTDEWNEMTMEKVRLANFIRRAKESLIQDDV